MKVVPEYLWMRQSFVGATVLIYLGAADKEMYIISTECKQPVAMWTPIAVGPFATGGLHTTLHLRTTDTKPEVDARFKNRGQHIIFCEAYLKPERAKRIWGKGPRGVYSPQRKMFCEMQIQNVLNSRA